jgi:hypothetical protein
VVSDGSHVLQQSDASSDLAREFNGSTSWTDYSMQATVKPQSFGSGDFVGIAARAPVRRSSTASRCSAPAGPSSRR